MWPLLLATVLLWVVQLLQLLVLGMGALESGLLQLLCDP
jgi:hypothetical protein